MTDIVENEQLPSWLVELRDQQIQEQAEPEPPPLVVEEPPVEVAPTSVAEDLRLQMIREQEEQVRVDAEALLIEEEQGEPESAMDLLDGLREQMILEDDVFEEEQKTPSALSFAGLQPTQRLLLAVLLFMNVAVCGCLILIMAGRVELPF
ncbi:MAG: hypothetical protein GY832_04210 [Chloroflexi bacterium]|nr:hypothetical protein [Chloroflexota bacterium]